MVKLFKLGKLIALQLIVTVIIWLFYANHWGDYLVRLGFAKLSANLLIFPALMGMLQLVTLKSVCHYRLVLFLFPWLSLLLHFNSTFVVTLLLVVCCVYPVASLLLVYIQADKTKRRHYRQRLRQFIYQYFTRDD